MAGLAANGSCALRAKPVQCLSRWHGENYCCSVPGAPRSFSPKSKSLTSPCTRPPTLDNAPLSQVPFTRLVANGNVPLRVSIARFENIELTKVRNMLHAFEIVESHTDTPLRNENTGTDNLRPIASWLRDSILDAYKPECIYVVRAFRDTSSSSQLVSLAEVCVPRTFYGSQTGHFNAVESVICLNQLAFLTMADFVNDGQAHDFRKAIKTGDVGEFKNNVLSRTFIASMTTRFRRTLEGDHVILQFRCTKLRRRAGLLFIAADFSFGDRDVLSSTTPAFSGNVTFAIPEM
jgi:FcoT-like thioesterase domain